MDEEVLDQVDELAAFDGLAQFFVHFADERRPGIFSRLNAPSWEGPEVIAFEVVQTNRIFEWHVCLNDRLGSMPRYQRCDEFLNACCELRKMTLICPE